MVNELTDVIGVLSKTRVNKDNCQLFSRKFGLVNQGTKPFVLSRNKSDESFIKGDFISVKRSVQLLYWY